MEQPTDKLRHGNQHHLGTTLSFLKQNQVFRVEKHTKTQLTQPFWQPINIIQNEQQPKS